MFNPILSFPLAEIEADSVAWRGEWFGDALESSTGQAAVIRSQRGFVPGYFATSDFVTQIDLACGNAVEAQSRANAFALSMCGPKQEQATA